MHKFFFYIFLLVIYISCSKVEKTISEEEPNIEAKRETYIPELKSTRTASVKTQPGLVKKLIKHKILIDTLFNQQQENIILFAKLTNKKELVKVVNEHWPEETEISYNVLVNAKGKIVRISESPLSESGDWEIWYSHYFDDEGKTFAYERFVGAFNTFCPEDEYLDLATREFITKIYSPQFYMLDSIYKMVDENNIDITNKKCKQEVSTEDQVFSQLNEYMHKSSLKL